MLLPIEVFHIPASFNNLDPFSRSQDSLQKKKKESFIIVCFTCRSAELLLFCFQTKLEI